MHNQKKKNNKYLDDNCRYATHKVKLTTHISNKQGNKQINKQTQARMWRLALIIKHTHRHTHCINCMRWTRIYMYSIYAARQIWPSYQVTHKTTSSKNNNNYNECTLTLSYNLSILFSVHIVYLDAAFQKLLIMIPCEKLTTSWCESY